MRAIGLLTQFPDYLLTDFRLEVPELDIPQTAIVKGDQKSLSIAAPSILAKTARDEVMRGLESQYPGYGLGKHKGYGTQSHRHALKRMGRSSNSSQDIQSQIKNVTADPEGAKQSLIIRKLFPEGSQ